MAFKTLIRVMTEDQVASAPKRQRKADRDFSPPHLDVELRPSRYRLAERLLEHFNRWRNDPEYAKRFSAYFRAEQRKKFTEADRLDAWLQKQTEPAPLRVRASELKDCARKQAFRLIGFEPAAIGEDSPHWSVAAISGEQLHLLVEISLRFLGLVKRSEFSVKTKANDYGGRVDAELDPKAFAYELGDEALPAIVDVKTIGPDDFKEGTWGRKVPGYIAQVTTYAELTGNPVGVVLLVDRGSGKMMDFEWYVSSDYATELLERATDIVEHAKSRRLPRPEGFSNGKPSFECFKFCPFSRVCFKQEDDGSIQAALNQGVNPKEL